MAESNKFCFKKNFLFLIGILLLVIGGIYFSQQVNKKNLSYKSEASQRKAVCGGLGQLCCANDRCNESLRCYSPELYPAEKRCYGLKGNNISASQIQTCGSKNMPCCTDEDNSFSWCGNNFTCNRTWQARPEFKHLNPWGTGRCVSEQKYSGGLGEVCRGNLGDKNRCDTIEVTKTNRSDTGKRRLHCYEGTFDDGSTLSPVTGEMCGFAEIVNGSFFNPYVYYEVSTFDRNIMGIHLGNYVTNAIGVEYIVKIDCDFGNKNKLQVSAMSNPKSFDYYLSGGRQVRSFIFSYNNKERSFDEKYYCGYAKKSSDYNTQIKISLWVKESPWESEYEIKSVSENVWVSKLRPSPTPSPLPDGGGR